MRISERDINAIESREALFAFLRDKLTWPLQDDDPEEFLMPVGETQSEIGLWQLLPFRDDDPNLVLLVESREAFRRTHVREALKTIRTQMRLGKHGDKKVSDVLFICADSNYSSLSFVRFVERGSRQPKLRIFGWDPTTVGSNRTVRERCLPALALSVAEDGFPDWAKANWSQAWDVERVTRDFFNGFDTLRKATLDILRPRFGPVKDEQTGSKSEVAKAKAENERMLAEANWATTVQLNRLLFVYFLADQGFLPGGVTRLHDALDLGGFHRWFQQLALEALGQPGENPDGFEDVPYLNGGLFVLHETEEGRDLTLPDQHYEEWFEFLGSFQWTLSETEGVNTISPHILGYLFERYINQKQMGAYYTKEDVTGYICRSTVIPRWFDKIAESLGREAIKLDIGAMAKDGNRRYLFPSVKQSAYLPTETKYEYSQRMDRVKRLESAHLETADDFVTNNLDLELLAEDWLATRKDPKELLAAYDALESITILDPTVGSGAFLLAALEILAPLYDVSLRRMEAMVQESGQTAPDVNWAGELNLDEAFDQKVLADPREGSTIEEIRKRLDEVAKHNNSDYFIRKRILLNNLFGVDIMPEAVEICKLRLYLALIAVAEAEIDLEPLPDVDLNYKAGNALVGYASEREAIGAISSFGDATAALDFEDAESELKRLLQELRRQVEYWKSGQLGDSTVPEVSKARLLQSVEDIRSDLDSSLYQLFDQEDALLFYDRRTSTHIAPSNVQAYRRTHRNAKLLKLSESQWLQSHRPFQWPLDFAHPLLTESGFDCIVGNPPWVEVSKVRSKYGLIRYTTLSSGNLYALCAERANALLKTKGRVSFIVQLPIVCADRMQVTRDFLRDNSDRLWTATFDDRPAKLFEGLEHCRSTIFVARKGDGGALWGTRYHRWSSECRVHLMESIEFSKAPECRFYLGAMPKIAHPLQARVFEKLLQLRGSAHVSLRQVGELPFVYYQESAQYWIKATVGYPGYRKDGQSGPPGHGRTLKFDLEDDAFRMAAILNSSLFYGFYVASTDCFHVTAGSVAAFPYPNEMWLDEQLADLGRELMTDLHANATWSEMNTQQGSLIEYETMYCRNSKKIIDGIDDVLSGYYGLDNDELDFVKNFDFKYRMGRDAAALAEE